MTPEERALLVAMDLDASMPKDGQLAECARQIASAIRAAEDEALERAAALCDADAKETARTLRALRPSARDTYDKFAAVNASARGFAAAIRSLKSAPGGGRQ